MKRIVWGVVLIVVICGVSSAFAQGLKQPFVVPNDGQTPEQQVADEAAARAFAVQKTGIDPAYIQGQLNALGPQGATTQGYGSGYGHEGGVRTLARGAAVGAALGGLDKNIDNQVGKRAAQGAVLTGIRRRTARREAEANNAIAQQGQAREQLMSQYDDYLRAYSAYMESKGYTVR